MKKLLFFSLGLFLAGTSASNAQGTTCHAQYTWSAAQTQSTPLSVSFDNASTVSNASSPNANTWMVLYYGDGSSSYFGAGNTTYHNYATPGIYNTMLVVRNIDSLTNVLFCADTAYQQVTIAYNPCALSITRLENGSGSYTFTANNLTNATGLSYAWDFGDNTTGTGSPVTHTYNSNSGYQVTLTGTSTGCTGVATTSFYNYDSVINCNNLHASFGTYIYGLYVAFNNSSTNVNAVQNNADWYFGDGTSQLNTGYANHTYATNGTYNVKMTNRWMDSLSGQIYCTDTFESQVTVTNINYIKGSIYWDSLSPGGNSPGDIKVWLIQHDTTANTLIAVDSQVVGSFYPYYEFTNEAPGDYLVKAAFETQTPGSLGQLPTYHLASVYWNSATNIHHTGGLTSGKDIMMQGGTVTSGPGFIGGNISLGAGKGTDAGVAGLEVYLRGANNVLIAASITNQNGDYSFTNIPTGTYSVYPEAMNYNTTPYNTIQVTPGNANVLAIDFVQKNDLIYPKGGSPTGIASVTKEDGLSIYPNPSKDFVIIESNNNRFSKVQIVNTLGQVIKQGNLKSGANKIELSGMNSGMYYLLISGPQDARSMKIIKQ
jgi:hypothetical protein